MNTITINCSALAINYIANGAIYNTQAPISTQTKQRYYSPDLWAINSIDPCDLKSKQNVRKSQKKMLMVVMAPYTNDVTQIAICTQTCLSS